MLSFFQISIYLSMVRAAQASYTYFSGELRPEQHLWCCACCHYGCIICITPLLHQCNPVSHGCNGTSEMMSVR